MQREVPCSGPQRADAPAGYRLFPCLYAPFVRLYTCIVDHTGVQCYGRVLNLGLDPDPNPESCTLPLDQLAAVSKPQAGSNVMDKVIRLFGGIVLDSIARWTRWRHQLETFSASLAFCAGNSQVTGEFPAPRPVTRSFDIFIDLRLNKQSWGWWFETPSRPLWRHCNGYVAWRSLLRTLSGCPVF